MLDLSQFAKPSPLCADERPKGDDHQPSSSSSSSMNGFHKNQKSFFLQSGGIKRRNSVHETSVSMANLDLIGNAAQPKAASRNQKYYRALNNYSKMRSMTSNIVATQSQYDEQLNDGSNGSSATGSDSSSSPTPSIVQKAAYSNSCSLGPLMSAVSKMENLSAISPSSNKTVNTFLEHRFANQDDYDDYEYLERNLGAEPLNSSFGQRKKDSNTTTNTNVTDYYTDESNSCHNEEILAAQFVHHFGNQSFLSKNSSTCKPSAKTMHQVHAWDHTSLASTNSIYSGWLLFLVGKERNFSFCRNIKKSSGGEVWSIN
ncbi:hypothetical protein BpHYR1_017120 [Brachionus plicatilis]|uniref:Uncharacterized protein n=1 Tax=Brachionus plicatilis TaxID=10195 RepID=A0A3M7S6V8_BRAPC|nr:hypothetical protein BpHYR1_017120 [Brachionus plicatilis]